jgi:hypothetical protein
MRLTIGVRVPVGKFPRGISFAKWGSLICNRLRTTDEIIVTSILTTLFAAYSSPAFPLYSHSIVPGGFDVTS